MRRARRALTALLAAASVVLTSAGCGLTTNAALPFDVQPGKIPHVPELEGVSITVGSKDFTEQILLAYLAELALSAAGADVQDLSDIKGSNTSRQALLSGQIDISWEYTGTLWINYEGHELPVPGGEEAQYKASAELDAKKNGVTWLKYSPLNDQYGFAVTEEYAKKHNLRTNSDLAAFLKKNPDEAVFCLETEFISRRDGFPAAVKKYGFSDPVIKQFGTGAIYAAVDSGTCNIGEIFTTDGRIAGLGLRVLEDDKKAFPQYNAAVTLRTSFLRAHPKIRDVLEPISDAMTNEQMIELCKRVDIDGEDPGKVALDWLVGKGFVTVPET
ncbi:glycine betaine ABC transporter substrate-binding protein [Thermocrispum municipale]|jgi:osmoprotectant transport system substrate-binding protein|uniref:glycine betaine ABC transporter substrate-binding protein n=1 Tax=Thermocrispum municipale TaxID=37926 RepID=UPI0004257F46|nr:glycine betaine ABC transporter substrate-binding protein [Thermocrispum municipale]